MVKFSATQKIQHYYIQLLNIKRVFVRTKLYLFLFYSFMQRQIKSSIKNFTYTVSS